MRNAIEMRLKNLISHIMNSESNDHSIFLFYKGIRSILRFISWKLWGNRCGFEYGPVRCGSAIISEHVVTKQDYTKVEYVKTFDSCKINDRFSSLSVFVCFKSFILVVWASSFLDAVVHCG